MSKNKTLFLFMLMPFRDELTQIYQYHIKTPIEKEGHRIEKADDLAEAKPILDSIINQIDMADIIIAELTGHNPNVFYELGMAHTKGKYVIQICQKDFILPFDIRNNRTIFYEKSPKGFEYLENELIKFVNAYLINPELRTDFISFKNNKINSEQIGQIHTILFNIKEKREYHSVLIANASFPFLIKIIESLILELSLIESLQESREKGLYYDFVLNSIKLRTSNNEKIKLFNILFNVLCEEKIKYNFPIYDKLKELIEFKILKQEFRKNKISELVDLFVSSKSYKMSSSLSELILEFMDDLESNHLAKIAIAALDNKQIYEAGNTTHNLKLIFEKRFAEISPDLTIRLSSILNS